MIIQTQKTEMPMKYICKLHVLAGIVWMMLFLPLVMKAQSNWAYKGSCSEGLIVVQDDNGKYGFVDEDDNVVIPCQWKDAWFFYEGLASVMDDNDEWHKIDKTGMVVE